MHRLLQQTHLYFKLLPSESPLFCRRFISTQMITLRSTYTFSTLSCRLAAKNTGYAYKVSKKISKSVKPEESASAALPSNLPAYESFAQHLASRQSPTILYQSDSHTWFIVSCYLVGGFCIAWAGINFWNQYLYPLEGTPPSLSRMIGVICIGMLALGCWFIVRVSPLTNELRYQLLTGPKAEKNCSSNTCTSFDVKSWISCIVFRD